MTKKIILFGIFTIIMSGAAMNAQVGINTENPSENAILDMKINSGYPKTVIPPVFTTGDRNGILPNMDLDNGMFFFNTSTGCFNYYVVESAMWLSLCGTMPPAQGMITDCDHIFVRGQYIEGTSLTNNNYISVPVAVTSPGTYVITATTENQPDNGYFFSASGTFTSVGNYVVNLVSAGTPIVAQTDNIKITFNGTIQGCNTPLVVTPAQPDYCINNVIVSPEFYTVGEDLNVPSTHFIQAQLQVYRPGQWQLVANTVNGYFFSGSGQINEGSGYNPNGGFPQLVTVIVPASGNVTAYGTGTDLFTLTNIGSASSCNYPFSVKLATVALSIACEDIDLSSLGTLKMNTQPAGSSVINVRINCTAPGPTILSATFAGLSYTSMVDPTNPSAGNRINIPLGQSIITLYPISTTQKPAVSGDILVTIKSSEGGLKYNCPTTTAHIDPSIAAFTSITAGNGTYMLDPLSGNTPCNITVSASTNVGGTYTITTDNVNGVTFSASSTAVLGSNTITLTPSGTPVKNGTYTYTLPYDSDGDGIPDKTTTFTVTFMYRSIKVLGISSGNAYGYAPFSSGTPPQVTQILTYVVNGTTRTLNPTGNVNFGINGTVPTGGITLFPNFNGNAAALKNSINNNKIDIIVIGYNVNPDNATCNVLADFVNNKKGVLVYQSDNLASLNNIIGAIYGNSYNVTIHNSGANIAHTNKLLNVDDPILNGPFGNVCNKYAGVDAGITGAVAVTSTLPASMIVLANGPNANNTWIARDNSKGFMFIGDGGFTSGGANAYTGVSADICPMASNNGVPMPSNRWTNSPDGSVQNAIVFANYMAWAINYSANNTLVNYVIP